MQNTVPLNDVLVGNSSWAIIVTDRGTWYNVTPLYLPLGVYLDPQGFYYGIPWNTSELTFSYSPTWNVTEGLKMLKPGVTEFNQPALYDGYEFASGVTNVTAGTYVNDTNGWLNITFYAPPQYIHNQYASNSYFVIFQDPGGHGLNTGWPFVTDPSTPSHWKYFFYLITTNPYIALMPPLYYAPYYYAIQNGYGEPNLVDPPGATNFTYTLINASIGIYIPINDSAGNIEYLYVPFDLFEITDVMAFMPFVPRA